MSTLTRRTAPWSALLLLIAFTVVGLAPLYDATPAMFGASL
ncbi:MAG TPA: hypothetical protein VKG91_10025 [Roseiarcus sp.]|nr:hypothetical protein [Roseiarcus sp.]